MGGAGVGGGGVTAKTSQSSGKIPLRLPWPPKPIMQLGVTAGVTLGVHGGHSGAVVIYQALQQLLHHIWVLLGQVNLLIWVRGHVEEPDVFVLRIMGSFGEIQTSAGWWDPAAVTCRQEYRRVSVGEANMQETKLRSGRDRVTA